MPTPVIDTRLMPTFVSTHLLRRERLIRRLLDSVEARLVVIHGEAGSGKSSLLFELTREDPESLAWYSLQESDRESKVFLTYLFEALHRKFPGCLGRCREMLDPVPTIDAAWQPLLTEVVNALGAYGGRITVILDDYHVVHEAAVVSAMVEFLVRNGPSNLRLVLASRRAPELGLPYLRAKGMLVSVTPDDLRFSVDEVERVFREVWHVPIDRRVAEMLTERTEGWVTGLRLVSEAVRERRVEDIGAYVEGLQGKDQFIYEYLATEVYDLQPVEIREFLRRTSILGRFNGALAQAVTMMPHSEAHLHYLEQCRLFLVHLDPNREWFRYHHLFGDFLRRTLLVEDGRERACTLHQRAAVWYERNGDPSAAVSHSLEAGDIDAAVRVLESRGGEMLACGLQASVARWLDDIPREVRTESPALLALRGDLADLTGNWPHAVECYEQAVERFRLLGRGSDVMRVLESLMLCYIRFGEADRLLKVCESALAACPPDDFVQRASMSAWLGAINIYSGIDWDRGYQLIQDAHPLAFKSGDPRTIGWACVIYGFAWHFPQGNFHHAETAFNEGIALLRSLGWSPMLYQLVMNKCVVLIFRGHLDRARELIEDTLALAERNGHVFVVQGLEMCRAKLYLESGELHRCAEAFSRLSERLLNAQTRAWYYRTLMLLQVRQGNLEAAHVAAEEMQRALTLNGRGLYAPECLVSLAAYHLDRDEPLHAEEALREALSLCQRARARFWEMKAHALMAVCASERRSDMDRTRKHLQTALSLSRENDYGDAWLVNGFRQALGLLLNAISLNVEEDYARSLLARFGDRLSERLLPLAHHSSSRVRKVALEYLGRVAPDDEATTGVLRGARRDRSQAVRRVARQTLRERGPQSVSIDIVTLGDFQVLRDGQPLSWPRRLPSRILKYLIAHYDGVVAKDRLLDDFWPEAVPERARRNLFTQVNHLRRELRPDADPSRSPVVFESDAYGLRLGDGVTLDVAEFDRLLAEGARMRREGDRDGALARCLRAESLCRGVFLPNDLYDDWLAARRTRIAQDYRDCVIYLADQASDIGNHVEAVVWLRKALSRDALDEPVLQMLLRACSAMGDRASARREFETFAANMKAALDLPPTEQTIMLMQHVSAQTLV